MNTLFLHASTTDKTNMFELKDMRDKKQSLLTMKILILLFEE
jgi:hypothetical protein